MKDFRLSLLCLLSATTLALCSASPASAGWMRSLGKTVSVMEAKTNAFENALPAYQWTPRSAYDYLDKANDAKGLKDNVSLAHALAPRAAAVPALVPVPLLPSPPKIVPPSLSARAFDNGAAGALSYEQLVDAKVFVSDPLHGSVFKRKSSVKYIILHSTETASPADAQRVILSWNNRGLKHPGSQFVVDRDGTIYSTVNPDDVTVHIDTNKCLAGYSNDNSVGIEIVRSGRQEYTQLQLSALTKLVSYLQAHYGVDDSAVTTHHHVQPSDRSDPVGFDFLAFEDSKSELRNLASRFDSLSLIGMNSTGRLIAHRGPRRSAVIQSMFPEPVPFNAAPLPGPAPDALMPLPAPDYKHLDD